MNDIQRIARSSEVGYLTRVWIATHGNLPMPNEDDLRAFLWALGREMA